MACNTCDGTGNQRQVDNALLRNNAVRGVFITCETVRQGIVNLSRICGKTRDPHDGEWRYSGVFVLGLTSERARIGSS